MVSGPTQDALERETTMNLEKKSEHPKFEPDRHVLARFLLYASRPRDAEPDETGRYFIGDVGDAPDRTFERWSPYSVAEPSR